MFKRLKEDQYHLRKIMDTDLLMYTDTDDLASFMEHAHIWYYALPYIASYLEIRRINIFYDLYARTKVKGKIYDFILDLRRLKRLEVVDVIAFTRFALATHHMINDKDKREIIDKQASYIVTCDREVNSYESAAVTVNIFNIETSLTIETNQGQLVLHETHKNNTTQRRVDELKFDTSVTLYYAWQRMVDYIEEYLLQSLRREKPFMDIDN